MRTALVDITMPPEQQSGKKLANLPSLSVTTLDALVQSLQAGDKSAMQPTPFFDLVLSFARNRDLSTLSACS